MNKFLFTSESVTEGHPDKVCDIISDSILDEILKQDENSRVACETMITSKRVIVSAEITTKAKVDYQQIVKNALVDIGYTNKDLGVENNEELFIDTYIKEQSPHIAQGVDEFSNHEQGAGDQGLMFGYACNETSQHMPLPITIAHDLTEKLSAVRKNNLLGWLKPDGKSQVTVEYDGQGNPIKVKKVVIATQHESLLNDFNTESEEHKHICEEIIKHVINPVLSQYDIEYNNDFIVNGTGRFVEGGPVADVGLTGRKIIVDTYGGYAKHGGGAFSGKDPSKVDRSAAYMARYIAKNIVAAKIADKCEVQLSYCIGVADPMSVNINSFGTGTIDDTEITTLVNKVFDLKPASIIKKLELKKPIYKKFAAYGHFGRGDNCTWEKIDMIQSLTKKLEEEK